MNTLEKLEVLSREAKNLETKKKILFLISHVKLLYKYGTSNSTFEVSSLQNNQRALSELSIITHLFIELLKNYQKIISEEYAHFLLKTYLTGGSAERFLEHCNDLLEIELAGNEDIQEGNVFLGIDEKISRANKSAREGNSEGLFSSLHTVIELLLKDKMGIALDMDGAKLGKVLRICIRRDTFNGKNSILTQLNETICEIDNKIKHSGYNPTAKQMNDALLVATQAVRVLKKEIPNLDEETLEEVSKILIKNN